MKINKQIMSSLLLTLICCFSVTSLSWAQGNTEWKKFDDVISMDMKDKPLRSVLQDISKKTGFHIVVSDDLLDIPITGNFKDTTLAALLGRMLKGKNVFILEDDQLKLITVRTSLSEKGSVTTVFLEDNASASAENYSLSELQDVRISLDKKFNEQGWKIESSPGISYQELVEIQRRIDQKLNTTNGKDEVEASPGVTYQELIDTQGELNSAISRKNSSVKAASGILYKEVNHVREELDNFILSDESSVESSPGVSYKKLLANQLKLDQQLTVRN